MNWPIPATTIHGSASSAASSAGVGPEPVSTSATGRAATIATTSAGTATVDIATA